MLFCHFAKSTSVQDISNGLRAVQETLESFRDKTAPSKSSISYQNGKRDADLFKDVFQTIRTIRQHMKERRIKLKIKVPVHLLDSTLFHTCLCSIGQHIEPKKGAETMHIYLNKTETSVYVNITTAHVAITRSEAFFGKGAHCCRPIL